jgi:hypothetical protein
VTFNAVIPIQRRIPKIIRITSRNETETLFTLSALKLLTQQSGWKGDPKDYEPDWTQYRQCFLYEDDGQLIIRKIILENRIEISE